MFICTKEFWWRSKRDVLKQGIRSGRDKKPEQQVKLGIGAKTSLTARISVLLPLYKPDISWLEKTLESLLNQTYSEWELVLSFDGDEQDNVAIRDMANRMLSARNNVVFVDGAHGGIVVALNRGLRSCHSEFVARIDGDDICRPERFQEQLYLLEEDSSIVACGTQINPIDENGTNNIYASYRYPTGKLTTLVVGAMFNNPIAHPALFVRTEALKRVGGYRDNRCMEDYELVSRLCETGEIVNLGTVGIDYRVHANQLSRVTKPNRLDLLKTRLRFVRALGKKSRFFFTLCIIPLILCCLGPGGERFLRRSCRWILSRSCSLMGAISKYKTV